MGKPSKSKSAIISGAGFVNGFMTDFANAVREQGGTDDDLYRLVTPEGHPVITEMAKLVVGSQRPSGIYPVTVNGDLTLEQMIAAGQYDWTNSDIPKAGFKIVAKGKVDVDLELVYLGRNISSDGFIATLDEEIHRVATAEEGLAFGAKYPDIQRQFPIVILGSVGRLDGERRVLVLHRSVAGRDLYLRWYGDGWVVDCRFLVARKPKKA